MNATEKPTQAASNTAANPEMVKLEVTASRDCFVAGIAFKKGDKTPVHVSKQRAGELRAADPLTVKEIK